MIPGVRSIAFTKASACGNDFLLIDSAVVSASEITELTKIMCDRHDGIGADGVEWMLPHATADIEIRLINADGSEAEISGNGTRCVAAYLCSEQGKEMITIQTGAGLKSCVLTSRNGYAFEFETEMGTPKIEGELLVKTGGGDWHGIPVSIGNPHFVIFVQDFPAKWQKQAVEIQRSSHFPEGVNVEFVQIQGKHEIAARFFERGAGETRSSGTGSCASTAAVLATGRAESPVKVHAPGGTQTVRVEGNSLLLRGPARLLCRGEFFLI